MDKELAILFIHRGATLEGFSASNFESAQRAATGADVIPLSFDSFGPVEDIDPSYKFPCWWSPDRLAYHWFRKVNPAYSRYLICEDDTYFNQAPKDFFGASWDRDAVGGVIVNPNLSGLYHEGHGTHQYWIDVEVARLGVSDPNLRAKMRGFISMFGLFSHRALAAMTALYFDPLASWLTGPVIGAGGARGANAEACSATLANLAGYEPTSFAQTTQQAAWYIWPSTRPTVETDPLDVGIWHPVKRVISP